MDLFILYLILCFIRACWCSIQCLDDNGTPVDWYVLYKLPKIEAHSNYNITHGSAYTYITSNTVEEGWRLSNYNISDPLSAPGKTLSIAYSKENTNSIENIFWLLYNDGPPNETYSFTDGHSKGFVLGDQNGGIWIVHSVPHYPPMINSSEYSYPDKGLPYGQSFLCMSLEKKDLDIVGNQLMVNWAHTYDYKFEGNLRETYPTIFRAAIDDRVSSVQSKMQFSSSQNQTFVSFAKSRKFNNELYSKWVAEALHVGLYVESWLHGAKLPSDCDSLYQVHNILKLEIKPINCSFSVYQDHSKYAVSSDPAQPWICIGDINRTKTQFGRAGGTVCFKNKYLWSTFSNGIVSVEPCPRKKVLNT